VTGIATRSRVLGAVAVLLASTVTADSCGFENPNSVSAQRGLLNLAYPNALYVISAVWRAQQEDLIERDNRPPAVKALLGYRGAVGKLETLRTRLERGLTASEIPAFSLMLVGPVLWSRYAQSDDVLTMVSHLQGPESGDLVVVTDEPVIAALNDGRLTLKDAGELGLIRYYGPAERVQALTLWLDGQPLSSDAKAQGRHLPTQMVTVKPK
jgi:hypothetical protein